METIIDASIPEDTHELIATADSLGWVLAKKREELGIDIETELQAAIAAARFGLNRYLAMAAGATTSPVALNFLAASRKRCYDSIEQLRRRVTCVIAHLCRLMDGEELMEVSSLVTLISR